GSGRSFPGRRRIRISTGAESWAMSEGARRDPLRFGMGSERELLAGQVQPVEAAEDRGGALAAVEHRTGERLHLLAGHLVDTRDDLVEGELALEIDVLAREIAHARRRGLEREHQVPLQMILGPLELHRVDGDLLHLHQLVADELDDLAPSAGARRRVDGEVT